MTRQQFLALSTELVKDMNDWSVVANAHGVLSAADVAVLKSAMAIVERATIQDVEDKPVK